MDETVDNHFGKGGVMGSQADGGRKGGGESLLGVLKAILSMLYFMVGVGVRMEAVTYGYSLHTGVGGILIS